jgi:hypothetical protein
MFLFKKFDSFIDISVLNIMSFCCNKAKLPKKLSKINLYQYYPLKIQ